MVEVLLHLLPLLRVLSSKRRKKRWQKRFVLWMTLLFCDSLFFQEESDEDMGFGLFD